MQRRLRKIPKDFDRTSLRAVDNRLRDIRDQHHVAIGLAVESGSRAWGFPSPDSDFDCRFIFVRRPEDYLSPWQKRDVIETPLVDDLDINGWELGKALRLLLKGNAVLIEWLMSPIVYDGDRAFKTGLSYLAERHVDRNRVARHYLHLGVRQRNTYFADAKQVQLKKLFYALRPAAALRWLRLHPDRSIAPMHFPTLMDECDPPLDVSKISRDLMQRKAMTRELGKAPLPRAIKRFLDGEFAIAEETLPRRAHRIDADAQAAAGAFFRNVVGQLNGVLPSTLAERMSN